MSGVDEPAQMARASGKPALAARRAEDRSFSRWMRRAISDTKASGPGLVSLFQSSVPEPVDLLRDAVLDIFEAPGDPRYVSAFSNGNPFVMQHLADRYGVAREQVLCTTGATGALSLIYRTFAKPGDHVLVEVPGFDLFHQIAEVQGLNVDTFARPAPDFAIDPGAIAKASGPRTKIVVLTNLHNPSGAQADRETLRELGRLADRMGVVIVVDEVYADYGRNVPAAAAVSPSLLSISSLTKSHGFSTLRCGWIIGDEARLMQIRQLANEVDFGISSLSHAVAASVIEHDEEFERYRNGVLGAARPIAERSHAAWIAEGLVAGELPQAGCIAFPQLVGIKDTLAFSEWLAEEHGVIVAPGEFFGAAGHVRIGFALPPDELEKGLRSLTEGLRKYRSGD